MSFSHIKRALYFAVLFILHVFPSFAQDASVFTPAAYSSTLNNYLRVWEVLKPETNAANITSANGVQVSRITTQYMDGLGRLIQTTVKQGSMKTGGSGVDFVHPVVYDDLGRISRQYLPFAASSFGGNASISDGGFKTNPFQQQNDFYGNASSPIAGQGETYYYGKTEYEPSPLNRVDRKYAPGNAWVSGSGRGVDVKYRVNTATDAVRIFTVTNVADNLGTYATTAVYAAGQLSKIITQDENDKQVIEFKDKNGLVILKKVQNTASADDVTGSAHTGWLCTYYIYDELNLLRAVIQPRGVEVLAAQSWAFSADILSELSFRCAYDAFGRMTIKKIPAAGEVWMVYDARDRLVLSQDSNLRVAGKWLYTQYDNINRPVNTGLWNNTSNRVTHQASASLSNSYPNLNGQIFELLTTTFYDSYWWSGSIFGTTRNTSFDGYLAAASNTTYPYPQAPAQSTTIKGLVTGTKVKVLGTASTYLFTIMFYDDKGNIIQQQSTNLTGGTDIVTTQYTWFGVPFISVVRQQKNGTGAQTTTSVTRNTFDNLGRIITVDNRTGHSAINSGTVPATWTTIQQNEYDALGQLKKKEIGNKPGAAAGTPLAVCDYEFNIRGWLLSVNKGYISASSNSDQYFGMELGYDKNASLGTFTAQYNGNLSGALWKAEGDQQKRKYNFSYDGAHRLTAADFNQYVSGTGASAVFNKSAGIDFSMSGLSYDANGNIQSMLQKGLKLNASATIDDLSYNYMGNSNRLYNVFDNANDTSSRLGDFTELNAMPDQDYTYDGNGNVSVDMNKLLGFSRYNYLNLPDSLTVLSKGDINYVYDANGNKLRKRVNDFSNGMYAIITVTDYIGNSVFVNDTLQYINSENGRIRFTPAVGAAPAKLNYDYYLKDHLGNIRTVLTEEKTQDVYPAATLEGSLSTSTDAAYIEKQYYSIDAANVVDKSLATGITDYQNNNGNPPYNTNPNGNATANSQKLYKLLATGSGGVTGLGITLKVMAGDTINIFGKSYYFQNNTGGTNYAIPVLDILTGLLAAPTGATVAKGATAAGLNGVSAITSAVNTYLSDAGRGTGTIPKAYINWVLFDENFRFVNGNFSRVGSANAVKNHYADAAMQNIRIQKNGYIYVYVSNESPVSVFFDNLQVVHTRGPLLEEAHYYPFGLTMAGISSQAFGKIENKYGFNGYEKLKPLDINLYESFYRSYDPQIGRFWQPDPKPNFGEGQFTAMSNNPVLNFDILGDTVNYMDEKIKALVAKFTSRTITKKGKEVANKNYNEAFATIIGNMERSVDHFNYRFDETATQGSVTYDGKDVNITVNDPGAGFGTTNGAEGILFEETKHVDQFMKGESYFAKQSDGSWASASNLYLEIDAKLFVSEQLGYKSSFTLQEDNQSYLVPTQLGQLNSLSSTTKMAEYLRDGIPNYTAHDVNSSKTTIINIGGAYPGGTTRLVHNQLETRTKNDRIFGYPPSR